MRFLNDVLLSAPSILVGLFVYELIGEDANGKIIGRHRSTGIGRPRFWERARYYGEEKRLAAALGNVRFLTMVGDGHTAFGGNSPCIDAAVVAQIETLTLPAKGTVCKQDVPFVPPPAAASRAAVPAASGTLAQRLLRLRVFR